MVAKSDIQREALNLPAQERIQLVVELWDSLAPGEIPVPDWQRETGSRPLGGAGERPAGGPLGALGRAPQANLLRQDLTRARACVACVGVGSE